jgi:phosphoribosylformylglycinamidine synthase
MLEICGSPALSPFRINKLLKRLVALDRAVSDLSCAFVHFVDIERDLGAGEIQVLKRLLTYGARAPADDAVAPANAAAGAHLLLVVPRAGTISPWSSKATDIAHVCAHLRRSVASNAGLPIACTRRASWDAGSLRRLRPRSTTA